MAANGVNLKKVGAFCNLAMQLAIELFSESGKV